MSESINSNNAVLKEDYVADDEIDLRELISVIWKGKWIIIVLTSLFSAGAVYYAINQPNFYRSEALLAPVEQGQSLGGLQGQLGGLASFAGINLGSGSSNNTQLALEILRSRQFATSFIQKHEILPNLMAVEFWNTNDNTIVYNANYYNASEKRWVREVKSPLTPEPSMQEAFKQLSKQISVQADQETNMITLSVQHLSPFIAQQWVSWLIEDINQTMKKRDVAEAQKSTAFLTSQLEETKISDFREVLFKLVEEQAKTIMFANVRDEYVFKTIDPALVPEEKAGPRRALICILGAMLGGILGFIIVIMRHLFKK